MEPDKNSVRVLVGLIALFLVIACAMVLDLWGKPERPPHIPPVDASFIDPAPVRESAAHLNRTGGDTSGFDCYACHGKGKKLELAFDALGDVVPPQDHDDIIFKHGRNGRNNNCFNCHDPEQLDHLKTRDGQRLKFEQSSLLCASCHGPTYRDWEIGIHGRTSGFWDRTKGEAHKLDCTSCHDPHAPAFKPIKPAPGPVPLHEKDRLILERLKGESHGMQHK